MLRPKFLLILADALVALVSFYLAHLLRFSAVYPLAHFIVEGIFQVLVYFLVVMMASYVLELYDSYHFSDHKWLWIRCLMVGSFSFFGLSALFYIFPDLQLGRGLLFLSLLLFCFGQLSIRYLVQHFFRSSQFARRVLIIGAGPLAARIAEIVPADGNDHSFTRFVKCSDKETAVDSEYIVGHISEIADILQDYRPQIIIIALSERRGNLPLRELMHVKLRGTEVYDAASYFELTKSCLMVEEMQPSSFIYTSRFRMTPFMVACKRVNDIIFSSVGLLLTSPLFPVIAFLIKFDSRGPVFFKQLRVGEGETEFFVYKFRTMAQDAEAKTGAVWAKKNDPRVTRIGRFMRKTRIDEIPQLYNVLKGDMSFIGPRPERMVFVDRLKTIVPFYSTRHFVKPGVTGWAQVCYPYGATDEDALEKLRYDLFYIKNYSVFLDFKIIFETIRVVLTGFGGR